MSICMNLTGCTKQLFAGHAGWWRWQILSRRTFKLWKLATLSHCTFHTLMQLQLWTYWCTTVNNAHSASAAKAHILQLSTRFSISAEKGRIRKPHRKFKLTLGQSRISAESHEFTKFGAETEAEIRSTCKKMYYNSYLTLTCNCIMLFKSNLFCFPNTTVLTGSCRQVIFVNHQFITQNISA